MLKENALVIDYKDGIATVKCQSKSACGHCNVKSSCGAGALTELTGKLEEHIFNIKSITPVKKGQVVEIGLKESSLLFSTLLIYFIPLLMILLSTFIGEYLFLNELIRSIFIFSVMAIYFICIHFYTKKLHKRKSYQPVLLRVVG